MMAEKVDPSLDVTLIREEENFFSRCAIPYISVERATVEASVKDDGMFHAVGTKLVNVKATSIDSSFWLPGGGLSFRRFRALILKVFSHYAQVAMVSAYAIG